MAASNPPGWLWASEGKGYDALEYHLQLPQEWLALGRIGPVEHNVYSYLPGYVEAAFYHVAVATGASARGSAESPAAGLLAGEGMGVLTPQFLHAGIAVLAAVMVGRLVAKGARGAKGPTPTEPVVGTSAAACGAVLLSIPWVIVTGSLPYNDLGVVLFLAAALIAALEPAVTPLRRGVLVGLLMGAACGVKPTALVLAAPAAAVFLAGLLPTRQWWPAFAAAAVAGGVALAPWLIRNWIASGNPVFPAATGLFGSGHWSAEQVARYAAAHRFDGSLWERLTLLVASGPADPATGVPGHRGLLHPQWSIFLPLVLAASPVALASRHRRIAALLLVSLGVQIVGWLATTHLQSRFLLPLVVPGAALIGLATLSVAERGPWARRLAPAVSRFAAFLLAVHGAWILGEQGWLGPGLPRRPNQFLIGGPPAVTGGDLRADLKRKPPEEQARILRTLLPRQYANLALPPGSRLYLLGEATPLYYTVPVVYTTTYDRSLLAAAMARSPADDSSWGAALRAAGVTHVLVNYVELERLRRSGFLDPDLKLEAIVTWLDRRTRLVQAWDDDRQRRLVELRELVP